MGQGVTQRYGTPTKYVVDILKQGKSILLCIDVQGARQVMKARLDVLSIFIKAPSMKELQSRLCRRGTEQTVDLEIRLKTAKKELKQEKFYDHVIINKELNRACQAVEDLIIQQII